MILKYSARNFSMDLDITGKFNVVVDSIAARQMGLVWIASNYQRVPRTVVVVKPKDIYANTGLYLKSEQYRAHDSVFIFDCDCDARTLQYYRQEMLESDNYFIFTTRDGISGFSYGPTNMFRIEGEARHPRMVPYYSASILSRDVINADTIITVGSGLMYSLVQGIVGKFCKVINVTNQSKLVSAVCGVKGVPLVLANICSLGMGVAPLLEAHRVGKCVLFDSPSLEHEILSRVFPKHFVPFSVDIAKDYPSEEAYYIQQLSRLLKEYYNLEYSASETQCILVPLLEEGTASLYGRTLSLSTAGGTKKALYPELRTLNKED